MSAVAVAFDLWRSWMASALMEVTAIVAIVWAADRLSARVLHPSVRHGLWLLVLLRLLLPPAIVPAAPAGVPSLPSLYAAAGALPLESPAFAARAAFVLWAAGAGALLLVWCVQAHRACRRLVRPDAAAAARLERAVTTAAQRAGLRRAPEVWIDPIAHSPYVAGLRAARLVLPLDWERLPPATLTHAIAHEMAHVRRGDLRAEACWLAAVALYWFHPLVHVARSRAHAARESRCDADVAGVYGPAYRRSMLELVAAWHGITRTGASPVCHGWGPAVTRLRSLERWHAPMTRRGRVAAVVVLAAAASVVLPTYVRPVPPRGLTLEQLVDPAARQASGLGSLHVRYELLRRQNLKRSHE